MPKKTVAVIGTQGLYSNYGGFDVLVRYLAEGKSEGFDYLIFNDSESPVNQPLPAGVKVRQLKMKASGFQGIFYDFWSILVSWFHVDTILLLGAQGLPLIALLRPLRRVKVVTNVGGVEWQRPKFGFLLKRYFRWCFNLSFRFSDVVILDNDYYRQFQPRKIRAAVRWIPYGGEIDTSMEITGEMLSKYPFLNQPYFLSVSRSLEDNLLEPLCESFVGSPLTLVLISNLSSSEYGQRVMDRFSEVPNIHLINGLYVKPELDLIRRHCKAYIHTHTLCGTAPSLVEMIMARTPICSIDIPQNRNTLHNQGFLFNTFDRLHYHLIGKTDLSAYIPAEEVRNQYRWDSIIQAYESVY